MLPPDDASGVLHFGPRHPLNEGALGKLGGLNLEGVVFNYIKVLNHLGEKLNFTNSYYKFLNLLLLSSQQKHEANFSFPRKANNGREYNKLVI